MRPERVACKACHRMVRQTARRCPGCGSPVNTARRLKRYLAFELAALLVSVAGISFGWWYWNHVFTPQIMHVLQTSARSAPAGKTATAVFHR
ncbi:MAG: hypothetical protein M3Y56_06210 [Armatimonadota bacterium]|nr:hypothetical protein [Armatimonadota bacterium]